MYTRFWGWEICLTYNIHQPQFFLLLWLVFSVSSSQTNILNKVRICLEKKFESGIEQFKTEIPKTNADSRIRWTTCSVLEVSVYKVGNHCWLWRKKRRKKGSFILRYNPSCEGHSMKIATKSLSNIGGTKYTVSLLAVFDVCSVLWETGS